MRSAVMGCSLRRAANLPNKPCAGIAGINRQPAKSRRCILGIISSVGHQIESKLIGSGFTSSLVTGSIACAVTEENGKSSAGPGFVGDKGAATEVLATIIGGVADLMPENESKFTFVVRHEMHQTYGNANQRGISKYLHVPSVKERTIRDDNCYVRIGNAKATCDGCYLLNLRAR